MKTVVEVRFHGDFEDMAEKDKVEIIVALAGMVPRGLIGPIVKDWKIKGFIANKPDCDDYDLGNRVAGMVLLGIPSTVFCWVEP